MPFRGVVENYEKQVFSLLPVKFCWFKTFRNTPTISKSATLHFSMVNSKNVVKFWGGQFR